MTLSKGYVYSYNYVLEDKTDVLMLPSFNCSVMFLAMIVDSGKPGEPHPYCLPSGDAM